MSAYFNWNLSPVGFFVGRNWVSGFIYWYFLRYICQKGEIPFLNFSLIMLLWKKKIIYCIWNNKYRLDLTNISNIDQLLSKDLLLSRIKWLEVAFLSSFPRVWPIMVYTTRIRCSENKVKNQSYFMFSQRYYQIYCITITTAIFINI